MSGALESGFESMLFVSIPGWSRAAWRIVEQQKGAHDELKSLALKRRQVPGRKEQRVRIQTLGP